MLVEESRAFANSVRGGLERGWGDATAAGQADVAALWREAARGGWFDLAAEAALAALVAASTELGRSACPLPLSDGYVAAVLWGDDDGVARRISAGEIRIVHADVDADSRTAEFVECAEAATHVLSLPTGEGQAHLWPILSATTTPGMASPAWSTVTLGDPEASVAASCDEVDEVVVMLRLALAARAMGAAEHLHQMAIEHAKSRVQFGKPIGAFGAVQQRTATCQIDVSASNLLIERALASFAVDSLNWQLSADLATEYISASSRRVLLGAHHTLAASGYFEEHPGPWLFRRVHADVVRLCAMTPSLGRPVDILVESTTALPNFTLDQVGEDFRDEVDAVIDSLRGSAGKDDFDEAAAVEAFVARQWFGFGWPESVGGREATLSEQVVLHDEITYHRVPAMSQLGAVMLLGNSILLHGTDEQKKNFLPIVRDGRMRFCLGYSEPEVGSDLASVRTKAVRDGDDWVINGQKTWTTGAHTSDYVWLATRTDPDAQPRHAGITVFLLPMTTPGITVREMTGLSGEISCDVFYEDVRVPDSARVGDVGGGWKVITDALAGERVIMGGIATQLHRQLDDLLETVRSDPAATLGPRGSAARARLGEVVSMLQATRALVAAAIASTGQAEGARLAAPMAAVLGGELAEQFGETMLDILGPRAALGAGVPQTPGGGAFEKGLRLSVMYVVGGGTNDIQRGLIARGLGLPR